MIVDYCWKIVRFAQLLSYTFQVITKVENWRDYYKDIFNMFGDAKYWIMKTGKTKVVLRTRSVDRWSALENLVLELHNLHDISHMNFSTIIDLGANIGTSMLNFHQYFPNANIVAIEPNKRSIDQLEKNVELNGIQDKVSVILAAVSDSDDKNMRLYINRNNAESSLVRRYKGKYEFVANMNFLELEKFVRGETLLKMDIEGGEYGFFKPKYLELMKKFSLIIAESHRTLEYGDSKMITEFLEDNKFNYYKKGRFYFIFNN